MNWGYKVVIAFVAFGIFLSILIYRTFQSDVQLVAPNYYEQELVYQQQIDKVSNEKALRNSVDISYHSQSGQLLIKFPPTHLISEAQVVLYRPSDATMDRTWKLTPDQSGLQSLPLDDLANGLWQVHLEWQHGERTYLKQQNIFLP